MVADDPIYKGLNRPSGLDPKGNVVFMETKSTDIELAQSLREALDGPLREVCRIRDLARASGLRADFQFAEDQFGRSIPPYVSITKAL